MDWLACSSSPDTEAGYVTERSCSMPVVIEPPAAGRRGGHSWGMLSHVAQQPCTKHETNAAG
jgi:hypothetical protein